MRKTFYLTALCLVHLLNSGCSSLTVTPESYYELRPEKTDPLLVVRASYLPQVDSNFLLRGKGEGAAAGAGTGFAQCAVYSLATGPYAPLWATLLCPPTMAALAVAGATQAETREKAIQAEAELDRVLTDLQTQERLAHEVMRYLEENGLSATLADAGRVSGPKTPGDAPSYRELPYPGHPTLLEIGLSEIRFDSPGTRSLYACLNLKAQVRSLELPGNRIRQTFEYRQSAGCRAVEAWLEKGSSELPQVLEQAYRRLVQVVVDELFLMYYPRPSAEAKTRSDTMAAVPELHRRLVPEFALRPISPILKGPELNLLTAFSGKKRGILHGFGGLQFTDVDSLTPVFTWESFPRAQDVAHAGGNEAAFSDVSYDFKIYDGVIGLGNAIRPSDVVYERTGLTNPEHRPDQPLDHCGWYFWTVRARFKLNGSPRVTEWSGIYHTVGGKVYPAAYRRNQGSVLTRVDFGEKLYMPIRTPASKLEPTCWEQ